MAVTKLKGSWWVAFMYNRERLRKRSPLNTKAGAEQFEVHLRQLVAQHGSVERALEVFTAMSKTHITFAEFAGRWMREYVAVNNKPSSRDEKRHALNVHLLPAFGRYALSEITSREVERYKAAKRSLPLSPKSINNHLTILRKCLDTAIEWGELGTLPRIKFLKTQDPSFRHLSREEASALIEASPAGLWRAMITAALRTGLRFSELVGLQWSDIDWTVGRHGVLTVLRANVNGYIGSPKNNRTRHIPITGDLASVLWKLPRQELVFTFEGRYVRYDTAWKHLAAICRDAGVPRVSWHDLRHTFASHLISAGAPLKALQDLLGHSTIEMTMRYAHLAPDVRHTTIELLEPQARQPLPTYCQPEPFLATARPATPVFEGVNLLSA